MTESQFDKLVVPQYKFLLSQAVKISRDSDLAQDLVQETLLKAFRNKENFIVGTNVKGWLYTILRNSFINLYRKNKRSKTYTDDTDNLYYLNQANPDAEDNDHNLNLNDIYKVIGNLDPLLSVPFMHFYEGYKYEEIAEELALPLGTVKSRIFKARKLMQAELTDFR